MLASPGVDLRREVVSSVTHVSSLGFLSAEGVPKFTIQKHIRFRSSEPPSPHLARSLKGKRKNGGEEEAGKEKGGGGRTRNVPAMRPAVKPPESVGRPVAAAGHGTGPGFIGLNVALIG